MAASYSSGEGRLVCFLIGEECDLKDVRLYSPPMRVEILDRVERRRRGSRPILCGILAVIDEEIKALNWKLWHGQVERAICVLEEIVEDMNELGAFRPAWRNPRSIPWFRKGSSKTSKCAGLHRAPISCCRSERQW
jgi:hypothetical protein